MYSPLLYVLPCSALLASCALHDRRVVATSASLQAPVLATVTAQRETLAELAVDALLAPGAELKPSDRALALSGTRVRLTGFMAELEHPLTEALYLTGAQVRCDEAGGGTADLPPDAVLVTGAALAGKTLGHLRGPVEASGLFTVGNRADASGRVSNFQLVLDDASVGAVELGTHELEARRELYVESNGSGLGARR